MNIWLAHEALSVVKVQGVNQSKDNVEGARVSSAWGRGWVCICDKDTYTGLLSNNNHSFLNSWLHLFQALLRFCSSQYCQSLLLRLAPPSQHIILLKTSWKPFTFLEAGQTAQWAYLQFFLTCHSFLNAQRSAVTATSDWKLYYTKTQATSWSWTYGQL